jgi:hypothetical protein
LDTVVEPPIIQVTLLGPSVLADSPVKTDGHADVVPHALLPELSVTASAVIMRTVEYAQNA